MKKRKKGRAHGGAMMVWLFFANMFDPVKAAHTELLFTRLRRDPNHERRAAAAPSSDG